MDAARYAALFRTESAEQLAEIDAALLALEQAPQGPDAPTLIATLFRGMHTIKGMAAAMGYGAVERLAHALESRCESLRAGTEALDASVLALLFEATAVMREAIAEVTAGTSSGAPEAHAARVKAIVARLAPAPTPTRGSEVSTPPRAGDVRRATAAENQAAGPLVDTANVRHVDVRLTDDCPLKGVRAMLVLVRLQQVGLVRGAHPAQEAWQADGFDGRFRVTLLTGATDEAIVEAARSAGDVERVQVRRPAVAAAVSRAAAIAAPAAPAANTVRIDAGRLDTLLDLVGELVITRDRLLRALEATEHLDRDVLRAARDSARLVGALQEEVLQARLLPVGQAFDRFPRLVRDVAHELGKEVRLMVEGRDIEVDRSVVDAIGEPLLHLLRNAIDHGIESPAARRAAGKPPEGELILRAVRERTSVVIQVQDDGGGIDRAEVLRRAQGLGLVPASVDTLDDEALLPVIAHPGFSTAREVTRVSGRGVGVDVVNTRVRALGGQLELETIDGVGTVVTLRLPVSLAITRALLVEVAGSTFALPAAHVEEVMAYHAGQRTHHAGGPAVTLRDEVIPLVALGERFALPASSSEGREPHLAIVESGGRRAALLVDALVAQQDIVVKPLDLVRGAAPWFSGATVLGDGSPALIVDVGSVV
jgi:two-component system chemotaxis sensor kinase CheA